MDFFLASLGIATVEIPDSATPDLVDGAEAFLRAEGRLTYSEWALLTPKSKAVFVAAGNRLRREQAMLIGFAIRGKDLIPEDPEAAKDAAARKAIGETLGEMQKPAGVKK